MDAHADRLLDSESMTLGGVPLARVHLEAEPGPDLLGSLLIDLGSRDPDSICRNFPGGLFNWFWYRLAAVI
jgi:hypothetical protein